MLLKVYLIGSCVRTELSKTQQAISEFCETHYEREAMCKAFHIKISFVCIRMKTNFHNKDFALSLAFIMSFKDTRQLQKLISQIYYISLLKMIHYPRSHEVLSTEE